MASLPTNMKKLARNMLYLMHWPQPPISPPTPIALEQRDRQGEISPRSTALETGPSHQPGDRGAQQRDGALYYTARHVSSFTSVDFPWNEPGSSSPGLFLQWVAGSTKCLVWVMQQTRQQTGTLSDTENNDSKNALLSVSVDFLLPGLLLLNHSYCTET